MDAVTGIGRSAPDFGLSDLAGNIHSLSDAKGRILVVNFWSSDCHHSKRADKTIQTLLTQWGEDVLIWSIASNANESPEELRAAAEQRGVPLVLHDIDQTVAIEYGAVVTPQIFVIDEGAILRYAGGFDDVSLRQRQPTTNYLERAVARVRSGRDPDPRQAPLYGCALVRAA
jgi:peroxiredoxin